MKREIKFRGKCSEKSKYPGEWVEGGLLVPKYAKNNEVLILKALYDNCIITYHVDKDTVCQFTGLYDKNKKEIYEGDILRSLRFEDIKMLIVYDEFEAAFMAVQINENRGTDLETRCHVTQDWINKYPKEVIGNIFDNKELLE